MRTCAATIAGTMCSGQAAAPKVQSRVPCAAGIHFRPPPNPHTDPTPPRNPRIDVHFRRLWGFVTHNSLCWTGQCTKQGVWGGGGTPDLRGHVMQPVNAGPAASVEVMPLPLAGPRAEHGPRPDLHLYKWGLIHDQPPPPNGPVLGNPPPPLWGGMRWCCPPTDAPRPVGVVKRRPTIAMFQPPP